MSDKLPSHESMFQMMQNMMNRIQKLENDNVILKQHMYRKVKKINVISHLNTNYTQNIEHIYDWISNLPYESYMDHVINNGIDNALRKLLSDTADTSPVRMTQIHSKYCYVYTEDGWMTKNFNDADCYIYKIMSYFYELFQELYGSQGLSDDEQEQNEFIRKLQLVLGPPNDNWIPPVRRYWMDSVKIVI